jgi:hypothetical protein
MMISASRSTIQDPAMQKNVSLIETMGLTLKKDEKFDHLNFQSQSSKPCPGQYLTF